MINEHDLTKKMLSVMRGQLLTEEQNGENETGEPQESSDVITPKPNDSVYTEEVKKLSDTVDPRVVVNKFKIYPKDRDVQLEGILDAGINFFMSSKAMKLQISITDANGAAIKIYVDKDLISMIQKLDGYYENWTREWAVKLNTEYKPK